jgi:hypothetical protein
MSSSRGADELDKDVVSHYQFDKNSVELGKTVSRPDRDVQLEDENSSSGHFDVNPDRGRATGDLPSHVLSEISAVRRVQELKIHNEVKPEDANSMKEVYT